MGRLALAAVCVLGLVCITHAAAPKAGDVSPLFPFKLLARSLSETERQARDSHDELQEEIQDVVEKIAAANSGSDLSRRENVAFGLGGRCGALGQSCSYLKTHCCGQLRCRRQKWYHHSGVCA